MLSRLIVASVHWAARHDAVPARLDACAARVACVMIEFYQRFWSRHSGRTCLFSPTCSQRAHAMFREHGWREGLQRCAAQLARCGGRFRLLTTAQGETVLVTADDVRFGSAELSPTVIGQRGNKGLGVGV